MDGEPLRATKPFANGGRSSRHRARIARSAGGRSPHSTSRSPRCVALAPSRRPAPFHTYLSLSAPVAPHLRNTTPSQEEVDHDLAAISRAIRGSPAQDTVAPDRARARRAPPREETAARSGPRPRLPRPAPTTSRPRPSPRATFPRDRARSESTSNRRHNQSTHRTIPSSTRSTRSPTPARPPLSRPPPRPSLSVSDSDSEGGIPLGNDAALEPPPMR